MKTIVRIPEGFEFNLILYKNLEEIIKTQLHVEHYSKRVNLAQSYESRINIIHDAFGFILSTTPLKQGFNKQDLENYLAWCRSQCKFPESEEKIDKYQQILIQHKAYLVNALLDCCEEIKEVQEAVELLNKAEQYVIMQQGRDDLATIIPMNVDQDRILILLWDIQRPPCVKETLEDLELIKQSKTLTTPFEHLASYTQNCFHFLLEANMSIDAFQIQLYDFIEKWQEIKKTYGSSLTASLKNLKQRAHQVTWYKGLEPGQQQLFKLLASSDIDDKTFDLRVEALAVAFRKHRHSLAADISLLALPGWFLNLKGYERRFLQASLAKTANVADAVSFIPSRLRTIPGALANFRTHKLLILEANGKLKTEYGSQECSTHVGIRDKQVLKNPEVVPLYVQRNLKAVLRYEQLFLIQTLISPLKMISALTPDFELEMQLRKAISDIKEEGTALFSTNHPLNIAKRWSYTAENNKDCLDLLHYAEAFSLLDKLPQSNDELTFMQLEMSIDKIRAEPGHALTPSTDQLKKAISNNFAHFRRAYAKHVFILNHKDSRPLEYAAYKTNLADVATLAREYRSALQSPFGSATWFDYTGRELFLSTYENLLITRIGGQSYGSCVSGKDRKWIVECHTDAANLYRTIYGFWPSRAHKPDTVQRQNFVDIVAALYVSKHGHIHAGQNANGANGIKTPYKYWPEDIAEAIKKVLNNQQALLIDNRLATNNEICNIGDITPWLNPGFTHFIVQALKLTPQDRKDLNKLLNVILKQKDFWRTQTKTCFFKKPPTGIGHMEANVADDADDAYKLAEHYRDISQRPRESAARKSPTRIFYETMNNLFASASISEENVQEAIRVLNSILNVDCKQSITTYP